MKRLFFLLLLSVFAITAKAQVVAANVTIHNNVPCGNFTVQFIASSADCNSSITSNVVPVPGMGTFNFLMSSSSIWGGPPPGSSYTKLSVRVCYQDPSCSLPGPFCNTIGDCYGSMIALDIPCCPSHPLVTLTWSGGIPNYTLNIN